MKDYDGNEIGNVTLLALPRYMVMEDIKLYENYKELFKGNITMVEDYEYILSKLKSIEGWKIPYCPTMKRFSKGLKSIRNLTVQ